MIRVRYSEAKFPCFQHTRVTADINYRLLAGNHHLPEGAILPVAPGCSVRRFLTIQGMHIIVAGSETSPYGVAFDAISCSFMTVALF